MLFTGYFGEMPFTGCGLWGALVMTFAQRGGSCRMIRRFKQNYWGKIQAE
jgi:hypothetical protein